MTILMKRMLTAIDYIEQHLNDDVALSQVSGAACYSHYHFLRLFHALTGLTAGHYIRRRRLTRAAEALLLDDERVIAIAQATGFESQASFSRAFKAMFSLSPAKFRRERYASAFRGQPVITEAYLQHLQTRGITMEPYFGHEEALTFIGLGKDYNLESSNTIGLLWDEFLKRKHLISNASDKAAYGLCWAPQEKETFSDNFHYTAALKVPDNAPVPNGMEKINVPAQEYAIFTHKGTLDTLTTTNDYIWKTWLPKAGFELADAPDIEVYGSKWDPSQDSGEIEIYVPIVR
ncbi:AraC family transcriptional regulator [uncultured Cohaesibacter sp.]|uniref:AraC family transcriptional regulator n=1 Tax=uncultured Cohaesibacter sp. TaxID=1002546 RepID=UPI002AA8FF71|nr:AraC family transcriptional regulator [uncultured Cohaesibacter sp.]